MRNLWFCLLLFLSSFSAEAQIVPSIPYNLTNGSLADATQVMGNFNTIVSDVNSNAATSGANSNITSLSGLTTPLSVMQGGTGASTASGAATNLGLGTGSAVTFTSLTLSGALAGVTTLSASSTVNFSGLAASELVQTDGSSNLISSNTLPSSALATTQAAGNNSTAVATTAYADRKNLVVTDQIFTSTGTYTPHANLLYAIVEVQASGGGGGWAGASGTIGAGGGSGGYGKSWLSAGTIGAGQTVTVGAGGTAGQFSGPTGAGTGGTVSFGSIISCTGGVGGASNVNGNALPGAGGTCSGAALNIAGNNGGAGIGGSAVSGFGANSMYGGGGIPTVTISPNAGSNGAGFGSGGSGAVGNNSGAANGGAGAKGIVVITEFSMQ